MKYWVEFKGSKGWEIALETDNEADALQRFHWELKSSQRTDEKYDVRLTAEV